MNDPESARFVYRQLADKQGPKTRSAMQEILNRYPQVVDANLGLVSITPLYRAISRRDAEAVKLLLDNNANINALVWDDPNRGGYETPYREAQSFVRDTKKELHKLEQQYQQSQDSRLKQKITETAKRLAEEEAILKMIEAKKIPLSLPEVDWKQYK